MGQRIVIDTCVLCAALRSSRGASHQLLKLIGQADFEVALSVPLVVEYEDAAKRTCAQTGLSDEDVDDVVDYLCAVSHHQSIHFLWRPVLRDPGDDLVLELAVEAGCYAVITQNVRDFVGAEQFGVRILRPGEFLRELGATR